AIFVTHDQEEAFYIADRLGVMRRGRLEQVGTPEEVFHRPETPFVAGFVGTADFLRGAVRGGRVRTALGEFEVRGEFSEGAEVEVMVRPDFIDIEADGTGDAVVVERTFLGMHYLYTLRLASGERVRCLQHHDVALEAGTRVRVRPRGSHTPVVFSRRGN
ncbi:MAG: TOBE domain-containing protein, partial [Euryarchaeota archaeon]|nr:TOBE domain-containing protein [Euryarchaeota archaeon]